MDDYNESLTLFLKPERIVLYYVYCQWLITISLLIWLTVEQPALIVLFPVLLSLNYQTWKRYYCLTTAKSVIKMQLSTHNQWMLTFYSNHELHVDLTDHLLMDNTLMLCFQDLGIGRQLTPKLVTGFRTQLIKRLRQGFVVAIARLLQPHYIVCLSEATLGRQPFRQLLRRLNAIRT